MANVVCISPIASGKGQCRHGLLTSARTSVAKAGPFIRKILSRGLSWWIHTSVSLQAAGRPFPGTCSIPAKRKGCPLPPKGESVSSTGHGVAGKCPQEVVLGEVALRSAAGMLELQPGREGPLPGHRHGWHLPRGCPLHTLRGTVLTTGTGWLASPG